MKSLSSASLTCVRAGNTIRKPACHFIFIRDGTMALPFTKAPESLCILRLSAIGDVTHVLPAVRTIQHGWPGTRLTWIIGKTETALVGDIPGIEFIVFEKSKGWSAYLDLRRKLQGRRFDALLNMQVSLRAGLISLLVKAPIKLGYDLARAKNGHRFFNTHCIKSSPRQHVLDSFLAFPHALGLTETVLEWSIPIPEAAQLKAEQWLTAGRPVLAINPCSSLRARNWRNWDIESYARVIQYAADHYGMRTVLTGGPAVQEKDFAEAIVRESKVEVLNLVGRTSLKELLAILHCAKVVIAPDTGPAHMANAVGTPVIGLYASSNPERTGPYLHRHLTVNMYPAAVKKEFQREVTDIRWGRRVRSPEVMRMITLEHVLEKVDEAMVANQPSETSP
jgi:heptosyltransferase I